MYRRLSVHAYYCTGSCTCCEPIHLQPVNEHRTERSNAGKAHPKSKAHFRVTGRPIDSQGGRGRFVVCLFERIRISEYRTPKGIVLLCRRRTYRNGNKRFLGRHVRTQPVTFDAVIIVHKHVFTNGLKILHSSCDQLQFTLAKTSKIKWTLAIGTRY